VLAGLVIAGNVLAPEDLKVVEVKKRSLKKYYITILLSVFVHLVLALVLFSMSDNHPVKPMKIEPKAINSYLYKMPIKAKKSPTQITIKKEQPKEKERQKKRVVSKPETDIQTTSKKEMQQNKTINNMIEQSKLVKPVTTGVALAKDAESTKSIKATFSAYKQLNNLRSAINEKIIAEQLLERQQFRSASVMHGKQIPVPHSNLQLTPEQEQEKRTTKSGNISITKYDNGICTIERKQFLGSPIPESSSAFACGESKFDKNFREHMKKVRDKLLPVKNK